MTDEANVWRPITAEELRALINRELALCSREDVALFETAIIDPKKIRFERGTLSDDVFAVAQVGKKVLFYDDTEDAFEVATPTGDGVIRGIGAGQFTFSHALAQIRLGLR